MDSRGRREGGAEHCSASLRAFSARARDGVLRRAFPAPGAFQRAEGGDGGLIVGFCGLSLVMLSRRKLKLASEFDNFIWRGVCSTGNWYLLISAIGFGENFGFGLHREGYIIYGYIPEIA